MFHVFLIFMQNHSQVIQLSFQNLNFRVRGGVHHFLLLIFEIFRYFKEAIYLKQ